MPNPIAAQEEIEFLFEYLKQHVSLLLQIQCFLVDRRLLCLLSLNCARPCNERTCEADERILFWRDFTVDLFELKVELPINELDKFLFLFVQSYCSFLIIELKPHRVLPFYSEEID